MMVFRIYRASDPVEAAAWDTAIQLLPIDRRDIHFTSAYGRVQEKAGGEALLAMLSHSDGQFMVQPFIKRRTPYLAGHFDLCSPYGYGGPVANFERFASAWAAAFDSNLYSWALSQNIVSEFCYLHPLLLEHQRQLIPFGSRLIKNIVVLDLDTLAEAEVHRRVRRGLKRAKELNVLTFEGKDSFSRQMFEELYGLSMDRKEAAARWRWSHEHIDAHYQELSARLFVALCDSGGKRALMVVGGFGTAYAHLLGSNGEGRNSGLDEALYWHAAMVLKDQGYRLFHLGGGLTSAAEDRLLSFKTGFTRIGEDRYKLAQYVRIFNEQKYRELSELKVADEIQKFGKPLESAFFPAYRREAA